MNLLWRSYAFSPLIWDWYCLWLVCPSSCKTWISPNHEVAKWKIIQKLTSSFPPYQRLPTSKTVMKPLLLLPVGLQWTLLVLDVCKDVSSHKRISKQFASTRVLQRDPQIINLFIYNKLILDRILHHHFLRGAPTITEILDECHCRIKDQIKWNQWTKITEIMNYDLLYQYIIISKIEISNFGGHGKKEFFITNDKVQRELVIRD